MEFKLKVDKSDIGKVIGKKGQNITAIRTLIIAASRGRHRTTKKNCKKFEIIIRE